jgi:glutathione S-transferase
MKLRYSPTSPYVRKVIVAAIEVGVEGRIEVVPTDPWDPETDLPDDNPLGKVPTLITEDGMTLIDSSVICEYLDRLHDGPPLFPPAGEVRWQALRWRVLGDGILDASVSRRVEDKFHERHLRSADWIARQKRTIERTLAALEREVSEISQAPITIGHISVGCALGYLDLRFPEDDWRTGHPALAAWYADFVQRPSMAATAPGD